MQVGKRSALSIGVTLLLLAGCSDYRNGSRPDKVAAFGRAHCASSEAELPTYDQGQMAGAGRVPPGFQAVGVTRCAWIDYSIDGKPDRSRIEMEEQRVSSVSSALSAALELPDQRFSLFSDKACPAIAYGPQYLILIDASSRAVMPWLPQTPCGDTRAELTDALSGIAWTERETYRFEAARN